MKIRSGFVSNSSSSSFCVYGISVDSEKGEAGFAKLFEGAEKVPEADGMWEKAEAMADEMGVDFEIDGECGIFYFGNCYSTADDSKTFGEFRKETQAAIDKAFTGESCSHIEEEIYG